VDPSKKQPRASSSVTPNSRYWPSSYCEDEPGRRTTGKLLTRNEARRIAANIAKLSPLKCRQLRDIGGDAPGFVFGQ